MVATASENRLTDHQASGAMDLLTSAQRSSNPLRPTINRTLTRLCLRPTRRVYCLSHSGGLGSFCIA